MKFIINKNLIQIYTSVTLESNIFFFYSIGIYEYGSKKHSLGISWVQKIKKNLNQDIRFIFFLLSSCQAWMFQKLEMRIHDFL